MKLSNGQPYSNVRILLERILESFYMKRIVILETQVVCIILYLIMCIARLHRDISSMECDDI